MKKRILIVFLFIVFMLSLTACTVVSEGNSDASGGFEENSGSSSVSESSSSSFSQEEVGGVENEYDIRLYYTDDDYTVVKYVAGELVDVSEWATPQNMLYEGESIPFVRWVDEWLENVVEEDFTMPARSMAFYAQYDMSQLFSWTYDVDAQKYTSKKA